MGVLRWLFGGVPDVDTPVPAIKPTAPRKSLPPPNPENDRDDVIEAKETVSEIDLDEVFAAIEYEDASGNITRRRITMQKLVRGSSAPMLKAICHERHAVRNFRTDRIQCFITADGEIIETEVFFRDMLGVNLSDIGPDQALETARYLRDRLRAPLSILMAAALSDGELHPKELDVIERFAENHIMWMKQTGRLVRGWDNPVEVNVTAANLGLLKGMIANMRPQRKSLKNYLIQVFEFDTETFERFIGALEDVISADDVLHPDELAFLAEMSKIRHPNTGARLEFDRLE